MGRQDNGTHPVNFKWPNVDVPEGGTVTLFYQIMNNEHKNQAEMEKALNGVAEKQVSGQGFSDWTTEILKWAAEKTIKVIFANCDGPIAPPEGRKVVWNTSELKGVAPGTVGQEHLSERGNNSPTSCGKNSHYVVYFSVAA
jgi:hypothetical protein